MNTGIRDLLFLQLSTLIFNNIDGDYICIHSNEIFISKYGKNTLGQNIQYYYSDILKAGSLLKDIHNYIDGKVYSKLFLHENETILLLILKFNSFLIICDINPSLCESIDEQVNESKTDFISNISHEFRTPLNGIIGMTDILKENKSLSKEQSFCVNNIEKCSYDLLSLVNDILDYSKLQNGSLILDAKSFSLKNCIESAIDINLSRIELNNNSLTYHIKENIPEYIIGDPQRLKQILINLISNSNKFTKNGKITINIDWDNSNIPDYFNLIFEVIDTGCGIPDDMINKLFKPFIQIKNNYGQGTGLGLVICRKLCKLMNGDIYIKSTEINKGTTLSFNIKTNTSHIISNSNNGKNNNYELLKNKYILIVDDNMVNRLGLINTCSKWGMIPIMCSSADEAIIVSNKYPFYAALIDIVMPEKSGFWLADYLKNEQKVKYPLIALSSIKEIINDKGKLFLHFIIKPVREQVLYDILININSDIIYNTQSNSLIKKINKSILIVDDIYLNRQILQKYLENYGFSSSDIELCDNGKESIELITKNKYDIIFLDIKMPEISGIDVYNHVKKNNLKRSSMFIAITGYIKEIDNYYTSIENFDYSLYKPIKYQQIKDIVDSIIEKLAN